MVKQSNVCRITWPSILLPQCRRCLAKQQLRYCLSRGRPANALRASAPIYLEDDCRATASSGLRGRPANGLTCYISISAPIYLEDDCRATDGQGRPEVLAVLVLPLHSPCATSSNPSLLVDQPFYYRKGPLPGFRQTYQRFYSKIIVSLGCSF